MEQLIRHPRKHAEPHPLDRMLSIAGNVITAPIRGLHYIEKSLTGTYTADQDFFSRYQWTKHHVEDLHTSLSSPNFWIKWSREGSATYLEIKSELSTLQRQREKARAIYERQHHCRYPRDLSTREIVCTDLAPLVTKLRDIHHHITKASGQSYIDKKQEDISEVRDAIENLNSAPVTASWDEWLNTHRASCISIQSRIEALEHTTYIYVIESEDQLQKLDNLQIGELQTLFSRTLKGIALKHYVSYASHEYQTLYQEVESELILLKNDRTAYHNSWGNYLWSHWESNHRTQATLVHQKLFRLVSLHQDYVKTVQPDRQSSLPSPTALQKSFKEVFRSFEPPNVVELTRYPMTSTIPEEWKAIHHRGLPIYCGEPRLASALQLMFSDPTLAKHTFEDPRQAERLGQLYDSYLQAQWNAQWATLENFIQTTDPTKPVTFDQLIHRLDRLYSSHPENRWHLARPFYDLVRDVANRTSHGFIAAFLSRLDREKNPLFHTLVHQTANATGVTGQRQTQQSVLHLDCPEADTLEALLERCWVRILG